ncbi:MAG: TIGR00725 family protein [Candidatus Altiarchaeota archaeon]
MKKRIAVIGLDDKLSKEVESMAERVGEDIAKADCILLCGGRGGVMEAACRGAKNAGGLTVGILPSLDVSEANKHVDVAVTTGLGYARNSIVVSSADAVIAVNGSTGTLSEIGMALNFGKPVVVVEGSGGVADKVKEAFPDDERVKRVVKVKAEESVKAALAGISCSL